MSDVPAGPTEAQRERDDQLRWIERTAIVPPAHVDPAASYDALWRKHPQRLGFMQLARAIPGLVAQFHGTVPDQFIAQVDDGQVDVACPCGGTPRLEEQVPTCCACNRVYVSVAGGVRVAYVTPEA